jgi:hypothetical protein
MAGSWAHMTTPKGKLLNNETFTGMIENPGDAYEAAGECYGMIWWLASALARDSQGSNGDREAILSYIREASECYEDGLSTGGVQSTR